MADANLGYERVQDSPRVTVIRIHGDVEAVNHRAVESAFHEALRAEQPRYVLLDLGGVAFGDSSFFSALLFWREELTKRGGKLVLFGLRPELLSTLRILALDRVLAVKPDQAAALASLPPG